MLSRIPNAVSKDKLIALLKNPNEYRDILFAVGILGIIGILLFPVPPIFLDFFLSLSLGVSVLILMTVLFIDKPLDFSSFPSILLVVTVLRLALNISTTRLILSRGHLGTDAAGGVVQAFGHFVIQGSVVIGAIVFAILTIINFVVITKGSGRIAEVAARFSLDAMPGKQMAIDADLSAGLIKDVEARERRKSLEAESAFYGAMDGANKFVRGDAIAGLLITFINFVAGIVIGVLQQDMSFVKAMQTYTILTIGDGLVTQIPALIVSISAGMLVTKSGEHGSTDKAIVEQLSRHPQSLLISSGILLLLGLVMPGIPFIPFAAISSLCGLLAASIYRVKSQVIPEERRQTQSQDDKMQKEVSLEDALHIDTVKLEVGLNLVSLVNGASGGAKIVDNIKKLRQQLISSMGFILPSVRIQDNIELGENSYVIKIKDLPCGSGELKPNQLLLLAPKGASIPIPGEDTIDPAFGLPARWISSSAKEEAKRKQYTVVEPVTVIITHLTEVIKDNITELLTYAEVQKLVDKLPSEHKKLYTDIVPSQLTLVTLQRVLQSLLAEGVSIRDLPTILEAVSEAQTSVLSKLVERVRVRLARQISQSNTNSEGYIPVLTLSSQWEQTFTEHIRGDGDNAQLLLPPSKLQEFVSAVLKELERHLQAGTMPVLVVSHTIRPFVYSVTSRFKGNLTVISHNEIHPKAKIKTLGQI